MEQKNIYRLLTNLSIFKIAAVIIMLTATTYYTHIIYEYGIFAIIGWGMLIFADVVLRRQAIKDKSVLFLVIFVVGNIFTIILNAGNNTAKQVFVLCSCVVYFLIFSSYEFTSPEKTEKEIRIIEKIIIIYTFIIGVASLIFFITETTWTVDYGGEQYSAIYSVRGNSLIQFYGLYAGNSTCALCAGISFFLSLQALLRLQNKKSVYKKSALIINTVLQYMVVFLTNSVTGIISLSLGIIVFTILFVLKIITLRSGKTKLKRVAYASFAVVIAMMMILGGSSIKAQFYSYFFDGSVVHVDESGNKEIEENENNDLAGSESNNTSSGENNYSAFMTVSYTSSGENNDLAGGKGNDISSDDESDVTNNDGENFQLDYDRNIAQAFQTGSGRWKIWKAGIEFWKTAPIFGHGYGTFYVSLGEENGREIGVSDLHNGYLEVLVCNGLIGALSIMLFGLYSMFKIIVKYIKTRSIVLCTTISLIIFLMTVATMLQTFILSRGIGPLLICIMVGYSRYFTDEEKNIE